MTLRPALPAIAVALALSACATVTEEPSDTPRPDQPAAALTERPTELTREMLIGRWGVASFREEKDRARVTAQARSFCGRQPYVITAGPRNGVMMHAADDAKLYELRLKGGSDARPISASKLRPATGRIASSSPRATTSGSCASSTPRSIPATGPSST